MELLKFRCPGCSKLFSADAKDIRGVKPKFQCNQCQVRFYFNYPSTPNSRGEYITEAVEVKPVNAIGQVPSAPPVAANSPVVSVAPEIPAAPAIVASKPELSPSPKIPATSSSSASLVKCPICSHLQSQKVECEKCGVVFEKVKNVSLQLQGVAGLQGIEETWSKVVANWSDRAGHDQFFQAAFNSENLNFASQKYRAVLEANPTDELAQQMQKRIVSVVTLTMMPTREDRQKRKSPSLVTLLILIGSAFIVTGFVYPAMKSIIAVGAAILVLGLGVKYFVKSL